MSAGRWRLFSRAMDIILPHPSETESLLLAHARLGHHDEVVDALKLASINARGLRGTPLIEACRAEHATPLHVLTVQALLAHKADVCARDIWGATSLIHAALRCSVLPEQHLQRCWPAPGVKSRTKRLTIGGSAGGFSGRNRAGSYDLHADLDTPSEAALPAHAASSAEDAAAAAEVRVRKLLETVAKALARLEATHGDAGSADEASAEADGADSSLPASAKDVPSTPDRGKRMSKRKSMSASAAAAASVAGGSAGSSESNGAEAAAEGSMTSPGGDLTGSLCRPRFASDGTNRHIQLVTLLLNSASASAGATNAASETAGRDRRPRASTSATAAASATSSSGATTGAGSSSSSSSGVSSVLSRTRNGVSAAMVLAASPSPDAVAILEWVLEKAAEEAARLDESTGTASSPAGASSSSGSGSDRPRASADLVWQPDAAGANIVHYCAYAANADALRLLMRPGVCDESRLRTMIASSDAFGRTPMDVLSLYSEETILAAPRTKALQRGNLWSEVPFDSRRREFRSLLTTLL